MKTVNILGNGTVIDLEHLVAKCGFGIRASA